VKPPYRRVFADQCGLEYRFKNGVNLKGLRCGWHEVGAQLAISSIKTPSVPGVEQARGRSAHAIGWAIAEVEYSAAGGGRDAVGAVLQRVLRGRWAGAARISHVVAPAPRCVLRIARFK